MRDGERRAGLEQAQGSRCERHYECERIEVSVRYCTAEAAPEGAVWLFEEELVPVCSAALLERTGRPPRRPQDFSHLVE